MCGQSWTWSVYFLFTQFILLKYWLTSSFYSQFRFPRTFLEIYSNVSSYIFPIRVFSTHIRIFPLKNFRYRISTYFLKNVLLHFPIDLRIYSNSSHGKFMHVYISSFAYNISCSNKTIILKELISNNGWYFCWLKLLR